MMLENINSNYYHLKKIYLIPLALRPFCHDGSQGSVKPCLQFLEGFTNPMEFLKTYLDYMVLGTLGLMSFIMLTLAVERYVYFWRVRLVQFPHVELLKVALTRNLTAISSIGSNAPYVGLLGTVLGILVTFHEMGQGGKIDVNTIMLGLAMALKATAAGLFVAIPAILFYNGLLRKVEVLTSRWTAMQDGHA